MRPDFIAYRCKARDFLKPHLRECFSWCYSCTVTGVILGACDVSSYVDREIIQFEVGIFTIKVLPLCDLHIFQYLPYSCIIFSETPNRRWSRSVKSIASPVVLLWTTILTVKNKYQSLEATIELFNWFVTYIFQHSHTNTCRENVTHNGISYAKHSRRCTRIT